MKKILRNIGAGVMIGALSVLPLKNANAQDINIDGWLEASLGKPTANLRLYPKVNFNGLHLESLIDINGSYQFSKTDVSYDGLKTNIGPLEIKPVATLFQDEFNGSRVMVGSNLSYSIPGKAFGFAELSINPRNIKGDSAFYTYNGVILPKNLGRIGLFTSSPTNDFKSTYAELEATGPSYKGIAPYARVNLQKGVKPTWQVGISVTPRKFFKRNKGDK